MHHPHSGTLRWDELASLFPEFSEPDRWIPLLARHHELIVESAATIRVTAVDAGAAPLRLYAESIETLRLALAQITGPVKRYVDVGSGGGFPGLVGAVLFPAWETVLIEAHGRTASLLTSIAAELGLVNVTVLKARAEEAGRGSLRESADLVTARAVAELRIALEYTAPLVRAGGVIALPKGSRLVDEEPAAMRASGILGLEYVARQAMRAEVSATPWTAIFRKVRRTPDSYPRRPGLPARQPL